MSFVLQRMLDDDDDDDKLAFNLLSSFFGWVFEK
jgi:hypothetical protein